MVKVRELRALSDEKLIEKLREARLELMKLKAKKGLRTLEKPASIRNTKKLVARILTLLNERVKKGG